MAFTNAGGREYYTNARGLSSGGGGVLAGAPLDTTTGGITNCVGIGRIKGILALTNKPLTFYMSPNSGVMDPNPSGKSRLLTGTTFEVTPANGQIFPFAPTGVTFSTGQTVFALY